MSRQTEVKPLRADARRNRDALVAKAREVFAAGGFDLRFDDFAQLAGVGVGTLYRHFPTREALAEAVYREELTAMCALAAELRTQLPPAEALAAFLRAFIAHLHANQGLARTLATLMGTSESALAEGTQALGDGLAELMAAGVADGSIRPDIGVGAVLMTLHGICAAYDQSPDDAAGAVTLILDGLRP